MSESLPAVQLPEHYKAESIGGMMPDDIVYPSSGSSFVTERSTGTIYVKLDSTLLDFEITPTYFGDGRTALMKILHSDETGEVEGYIADLRHLKPGSVYPETLVFTDDMTDGDRAFVEGQNRNRLPLLGAIFLDMDGVEYFDGPERLTSYAMTLAVALDTLEEEHDSDVKKSIESHIPEKTEEDAEVQVEEGAFSE